MNIVLILFAVVNGVLRRLLLSTVNQEFSYYRDDDNKKRKG